MSRKNDAGAKVTVYDVAQRAGVSIATVSFAFTRPEKIKASTLENVMAAADELGYVPSANARGLAKGRTGAIGLYAYDYALDPVVEPADRNDAIRTARFFPLYVDEVQRGVQMESRRRGLALMIGGNRSPQHLPHVIEVAGRVDGLIVFAGALSLTHLEQVVTRIPVVELGGEVRAAGVRTVFAGNGPGMSELVEHLLAVHGYRRFAYLGELGTQEFRERRAAFVAALELRGLPVPPVIPAHAGDDATTVAAIEGLLRQDELPEVIVCDTDQSALVAIDVLVAAGKRVPHDIAVTGFDGIIAGRLSTPTLASVRQPMADVGEAAVASLMEAIADPLTPATTTELRSVFVPGGSCGCA